MGPGRDKELRLLCLCLGVLIASVWPQMIDPLEIEDPIMVAENDTHLHTMKSHVKKTRHAEDQCAALPLKEECVVKDCPGDRQRCIDWQRRQDRIHRRLADVRSLLRSDFPDNGPNRFGAKDNGPPKIQKVVETKLLGSSWYHNIFSLFGSRNDQLLDSLADLIDNITDIYDASLRYIAQELKMAKTELRQQKLVLDYLAAQKKGSKHA